VVRRLHVHCQPVNWRKYMKLHIFANQPTYGFAPARTPLCFKSVHQVGVITTMAGLGFVAIYIPVPGELLFRVTTGHVTLS